MPHFYRLERGPAQADVKARLRKVEVGEQESVWVDEEMRLSKSTSQNKISE